MYCPQCGAEYRPGFTSCHDCDVPLVASPPPDRDAATRPSESTERLADLVVVFQAGDPLLMALAKATLESEGIPFVTQGEGVQDLIGFGRLPGGFNVAAGPVRIHVRAADAERARTLLADLDPR